MSINKDSQKAPNLRFKGFTDDWEQRKLREVGNVVTGSTPSTLDKTNYNGSYLFVSPADIKGNRYVDKTTTTLSEKGFRKGRILKEGAILFVSIGSTIGKVAQIRQEAVTNQQINAVVPHEDYDDNFIFSTLVKESEKIRLLSATQAVPIMNKTTFSNIDIHIPGNIKEQIQMGAFFNKMDDAITLHQRKLDQLNQLKEALLQQMFPGKGETVPKLRFAGFEGDWEERKLGDLLNKNTEKNKDLSVINVESVSNKTGFTKQTEQFEDYSVASADLSNYYVIRERQFAYNPSRINVGSIAYKALGDDMAVVSPLYVSFSTKKGLHDGFIWNWFKTPLFDAQRQRLSEGGVRDTLSFNQLSEMDIIFPEYLEQEKISDVFKKLDNTITLQQRKLDQLQNMKQVLLQNMFI
ncbi:restriction endonuclease subunit S [Aerococcus urinaeequi]|uniref:restriction endonuclease subunit S n=1 Tax=Aerococcus urinaeequi TaxID=51665 RepID=UPI0008461775|nr:restriction endonuclease subunit S [Aerococcus urinaeequi]